MVRRHEFGPEGHAYVRTYLESSVDGFGKRLGGLLLEQHDVERGSFGAFVRADIPPDKLVDFETGASFPKFDPDWTKHADGWLRECLGEPERVLLIEDPYSSRTDQSLENNPERRAVFCGDDVYEYYALDDAELLGWWGGATWAPWISLVATAPALGELENRQSLSPETLSDIAAGAVAVGLGAWDDEGWLVWEPERPAR